MLYTNKTIVPKLRQPRNEKITARAHAEKQLNALLYGIPARCVLHPHHVAEINSALSSAFICKSAKEAR